jgi:hypothetical protein
MMRRIPFTLALASSLFAAGKPDATIRQIVAQIQKADYQGDRPALQSLNAKLAPFESNKALGSRVLYWRGFALWRLAMNGFNDNVDPAELTQDLQQAKDEFDKSAAADPAFVEAKIGALSCASLLAFSVGEQDQSKVQARLAESRKLRAEIVAAAPGNPRYLWVFGPNMWYIPESAGGGQAKAIEMYQQGLESASHQSPAGPLDPTWGQPELLMNLAWSNLNRTTPDFAAAEQFALSALKLVPYWHYVRDILLPKIREAQAKASKAAPGRL